MSESHSRTRAKGAIMIMFTILASIGIAALVYSHPTEDAGRTIHPPAAPVNPNPSNNAKGIMGESITLMWIPQERYRGDHTSIDQSWVKVSTEGPVYSDDAHANVFNGAVMGTALDVPIEMGRTYYWAVKCHDEDGWGPYSNWKFFTNSYPTAEILTVRPNPAREGVDVEFRGKGEDSVDQDAIIAYEWKSSLQREVISEEKNFFIDDLDIGTHEITLRVQDNQGLWSQITDESTITVKVNANSPPTEPKDIQPVETHSLSPDIVWYPSSDEEGDEITYQLTIGTSPQGSDVVDVSTTQTFYYLHDRELQYSSSYKNGKSENIYYLYIRADDGFNGVSDTVEHRFKVINHMTLAPEIEIKPESPSITGDLNLEIVEKGKDPDGDGVKHTVQWYMDDNLMREYENDYRIPKSRLEAGQRWEARVTPNDGITDGITAVSVVEIINTPPEVKISHPKEGLVMDEDMALLLDAINTTDIDPKDKDKLTFAWRSDRDGELDTGGRVTVKGLSIGIHVITLQISDGKNTVERSVTIVVEEAKTPVIVAKVQKMSDTLYVGDEATINVWIKNEGNGKAKDINMILFNDKNGDLEIQAPEKKGSRLITELDANQERTIAFTWIVETNPNNILVQIDGKNLRGGTITTITADTQGGDPSSSGSTSWKSQESSTGDRGGLKMEWYYWLIIIGVVIFGLGIAAVLIYNKSTSYDEEDELDEGHVEPAYGASSYSDPYAQQLQQQLSQLQSIISTYMPQYASYAYGAGAYPALPPAGVDSAPQAMQMPALPPGPMMPYQSYSHQPIYSPFQTMSPQAPLALPPAPSDAIAQGQGQPPGGAGEYERPGYGYAAYSPYAAPTAPTPGAFQPTQPDYSFSPEYQSYQQPFMAPGAGYGEQGAGPVTPPGHAMPPRPPRPPRIVQQPGPDAQMPGPGQKGRAPEADPENLPTLSTIFEDRGMEYPGSSMEYSDSSLGTSDTLIPEIPKPSIITPKILCHICRAPVKVTSDERPFITSCDSCGAAVEVS